MENKSIAVLEVLDYELDNELAAVFYYNVYEYILHNDNELFLKIIDYRMNLKFMNRPAEEYHVFKFMLQMMLKRYPSKLKMLSPAFTSRTA
jgi:hypothetical protein